MTSSLAMMRIGLLGGMSWESSAEYYRLINEATRERLGGLHSADCVLRSVDFAEIEELQRLDAWPQAGERLASEARILEAAGSELLVLCTNTMHKVADMASCAVGIPLVQIADATADAVRRAGLSTVGLIATAYTMEQDFYVGRLRDMHALNVLVPGSDERRLVHDVIYDELCVGVISDDSRSAYRSVIAKPRHTRRRRDPARLHRDRSAHRSRRRGRADLRHDHPARPAGCRPCPCARRRSHPGGI
jgi:aspartate racemase